MKYDDIKIGDFVEALSDCGTDLVVKQNGRYSYICKVVDKDIDNLPKPNIVIENKEGKQAKIHSKCGQAYFRKVNSYLG
jgi:hypothetical protein